MARIRTIKPEFFTDEDLGDLPPLVRLFFAGLWCHADKAGRLKYQPRELKAKILPYDRQYSASKCVELLRKKRCVRTYEADGVTYLAICNWDKHQKPHHTERDTTIPPPPDNGCLTVRERTERKGKEGKGKEGKKTPPKPPKPVLGSDDVEYPEGMDTPAVRKAVDDWLAYKRKRGDAYKDPVDQIRRLLAKDEFGGNPEIFVAAVDNSIACNYAGCYPPKGNHGKNRQDTGRRTGRLR